MPLLRAFNTVTHPCQARVASGREYWMLVYTIRLGLQDLLYSSVPRHRIYFIGHRKQAWVLRLSN